MSRSLMNASAPVITPATASLEMNCNGGSNRVDLLEICAGSGMDLEKSEKELTQLTWHLRIEGNCVCCSS